MFGYHCEHCKVVYRSNWLEYRELGYQDDAERVMILEERVRILEEKLQAFIDDSQAAAKKD